MEFIDLKTQLKEIRPQIDQAISRVLDHGKFILGPEVHELENQLAEHANVAHCVTCANGTDALVLALRALNIGPGDAVIVPAFTFAATAESVCNAGATPVFVDVQTDTFNIDPASIASAIAAAKTQNLRPSAVICVDLFGLPADYSNISVMAKNHDLHVIADAAQSFGASAYGKPVGSLADITTTSFFPAKPLGCYGDGGAIFTDNSDVAEKVLSLRVHGKGSDKYDNVHIGYNSRLDTIQAAVLLEKLKRLDDEIATKNKVANTYRKQLSEKLSHVLHAPSVGNHSTSAWAQYTLQCEPAQRDKITEFLKSRGIPTAVYYPTPLHKSTAYGQCPVAQDSLPVSEMLSTSVFSLPMHAYLSTADIDRIVDSLEAFSY